MGPRAWIIFAVICVGVLGGLVFWSKKDQVSVDGIDQTTIQAASNASGNIADHTFGLEKSDVILIEYGDFQCPACGSAYPILKQLTDEFKDKITFVFRNNPITQIHPNAKAAAAAAEAAGLQGKYWEMHDALYENQNEWSNASVDDRGTYFEKYAKNVGVSDMKKFKSDFSAKNVSDKISYDLALAKTVPVTGTPTILLNGDKIESDVWADVDKFRSAIDDAL